MRVLNTLYVQGHRTSVGLQKDALMVRDPVAGSSRVPLEAIEGVVLLGNGQISSQALARCAQRKIRVCSVNRGGKVRFIVGGPVSGNVHLRMAQLRAHDEASSRASLSRSFVAGKLQNCRSAIRRWSWDAVDGSTAELQRLWQRVGDRLVSLQHADSGDSIRGVEGDGTRWYFAAMGVHLRHQPPGFRYSIRTRRPPRDPVNALLSFSYGLLLTEVAGALETVGLDPQIGYLHGVRPGRPSLALDLLEELRPCMADRLSVRLLNLRLLREAHFTRTPGGACYLSEEGRRLFLAERERFKDEEVVHRLLDRSVPRWTIPQLQATLLARHLRGDLLVYPPFVSEP